MSIAIFGIGVNMNVRNGIAIFCRVAFWFFAVMASRAARVTLAASAIFASVTIWGVHYLQRREAEVSLAIIPFGRTDWRSFCRPCIKACYAMTNDGGRRCCRGRQTLRSLSENSIYMSACNMWGLLSRVDIVSVKLINSVHFQS